MSAKPDDRDALQVVWFKRDLRTADHAALAHAAQKGPVLPFAVIEPAYWELPDTSGRQYDWWTSNLRCLQSDIERLGGTLLIAVGSVSGFLENLIAKHGSFELHAHEETGNYWTFERDREVRRWCTENAITFREYPQYGIRRGSLLNRDRWAKDWDAFMGQPQASVNDLSFAQVDIASQSIPDAASIGIPDDPVEWKPDPGTSAARDTLRSFLYERGRNYRTDMSSPTLAATGGSRLSPYLAVGAISMRECYQETVERQAQLEGDTSADAKAWRASLKSFVGRLHWHCHFIQKLERDPELEWRPAVRAYEGMRPPSDTELLDAFASGRTGFPFVDACMRQLRATGWINFRMRAMLMSFACYDLFLRWQDAGMVLAKLFTDYEPGIHWTQAQMQSGESGINTLRIYNPIKQGRDHDPNGDYIRKWVPQLSECDRQDVHEPWNHDCGQPYIEPIVDHAQAVKAARDAIWTVRKRPEVREEAARVVELHGSRRRPPSRRKRNAKTSARKVSV